MEKEELIEKIKNCKSGVDLLNMKEDILQALEGDTKKGRGK